MPRGTKFSRFQTIASPPPGMRFTEKDTAIEHLPELTPSGALPISGRYQHKGRPVDWESTNLIMALLIGIESEIEVVAIKGKGRITIPAGVPLTIEQAARAVGVRITRARRLMVDPVFTAELEKAAVAYRAFLEPGSIKMALSIRDDETNEPIDRIRAATFLRGPRPVAGVQVNVQQNNNRSISAGSVILPGYVINLSDPAPEPKVVEHTDTPVVPARPQSTVGDQERDIAREKAELAAPRVSRG